MLANRFKVSLYKKKVLSKNKCINFTFSVRLPMVEYDPALDNIQVNVETRKALTIYCSPVSTTFVIFDE